MVSPEDAAYAAENEFEQYCPDCEGFTPDGVCCGKPTLAAMTAIIYD